MAHSVGRWWMTGGLVFALLLAGCVPPPVDDDARRKDAPVVTPKPPTVKPKAEKPAVKPDSKKMAPLPGLPTGWQLVDPNKVLDKAMQAPDGQGVLLSTKPTLGLELFSAQDAQGASYYQGLVDGAHLIRLPQDNARVLIIFSNRKNARSSVLLRRQ